MDRLTLKGLTFRGFHGLYEKERSSGNDFEVDLVFYGDFRKAAAGDDLKRTVDYEHAAKIVREIMKGPSVKLIETLTTRIGDKLFDYFSDISKLEVSVRKLQPPMDIDTEYSEIEMTWQR